MWIFTLLALFSSPNLVATTADGAAWVSSADLDGDGDADLLSGSSLDGRLAWFENNGQPHPSFVEHTISSSAPGALSIEAADLDGDGRLDVLCASFDDDTLAWYRNDGASPPGFSRRVISSTAEGAIHATAADLDRDGDLDVLCASFDDGTLAWYENDGAAQPAFSRRAISTKAAGIFFVLAADLDRDGDPDAITASNLDDTLAWYENDGAAAPSFTFHAISTAAVGAVSLAVVDLDRDGDLDVIGAALGSDSFTWYENVAAPGLIFVPHRISATSGVLSVGAGDLDGDGDMDLVLGSTFEHSIAWYSNDGASPPQFVRHLVSASVAGVSCVAPLDLDGDGDPDLVSASFDEDTIAWYENKSGHRDILFPSRSPIATDALGAQSLSAVDLDRDGNIDVLSASLNDNSIAWYRNDGGRPPVFTEHLISASALGAFFVRAADLDRDGDSDVLSASFFDSSITWYENRGEAVPTFVEHSISSTEYGATSVEASDLDGDGDPDVLASALYSDRIAWYENDAGSPPAFTEHIVSEAAKGAFSAYAADVDGDGDMDILSASSDADSIAWHENDGARPPAFAEHPIDADADKPFSVYAIDLDRDGDPDVLGACFGDDRIVWYENDGAVTPTFRKHQISDSADGAYAVYATDVDRDGDVDVFSASEADDTIAWYKNDGARPPSFTKQVISDRALVAYSVDAADLDHDGRLDLLSASFQDNTIAWYPATIFVPASAHGLFEACLAACLAGLGQARLVRRQKIRGGATISR